MVGTTFFVLYGIFGKTNEGLGKAQKAARGRSMKARPTQSRKGVKGGTSSLFVCPLQGQGTASLVGFGATPQLLVGRSTQRKKSTKGAGSEASLPVTLRVRRRAPKLLFPQDSVKNQSKGKSKRSLLMVGTTFFAAYSLLIFSINAVTFRSGVAHEVHTRSATWFSSTRS